MRAILIPADETLPVQDVQIPDDPTKILDALQQLVDGDIQFIPYPGRLDVSVYCNEEGKLRRLPANPRATDLMRNILLATDFLVGDVVVCGTDPQTGETADLPDLPALQQLM